MSTGAANLEKYLWKYRRVSRKGENRMTLYEYDAALEITNFCGVDEAGRGPLAGDVYAAAVILDPQNPLRA